MASRISSNIKRKLYLFRYRLFEDFVFVHINKTGGSSVEKALKIPQEHLTALEYLNKMSLSTWKKKITFAIVRNPWDKVVSHFHYRILTNQTGLGKMKISFSEWLQAAYGENDPTFYDSPKMFMPQYDWISDKGDNILVKHICRFENLTQDFQSVMKILDKKVILPHIKKTKRGNYREYFNDTTAEIVSKWFAKDIHYFDYKF